MNAKDILSRRFEKATFNGYKTDDVDEFLRELSSEFAQLQKDKNELERKLEVLADKIREYRDDEDALKDALLLAQKQGNQIVNESKAAAEKLREETKAAVEKQLKEAQEKANKVTSDADEYAKRMTKEANERADKLVKDARAKADEIDQIMKKQTEIQQNILQKTRKEADEYRNRLLTAYKSHMDLIAKLPEMCENEYIRQTAAEAEKREAERTPRDFAITAGTAAAAKQAAAKAAKPAETHETAAAPAKPEAEKQPAAVTAGAAEEPFRSMPEDKQAQDDSPFFSVNSMKKTRRTADVPFENGNLNK